MKKIILFVVSLFPLWGLGGFAFAQTVTITPVSADYNKKTVTFRVAWEGTTVPENRVWVWIDVCSAKGETPAWFAPATITAATATAGSVDKTSLNGRGFFVTQNPATVTATLNTTLSKFNWCAYGSGAPPKALLNEDGSYALKGTPPFTINGNITVDDYTYPAGMCLVTITDLTGNPAGIVQEPTISITTSQPTQCCAGNVLLMANVSSSTINVSDYPFYGFFTGTYTWIVGGGVAQTTTAGNYIATVEVGSTTYSVTVTNAAGCTSAAATGTITAIAPAGAAAISGSSSNTCPETTVELTATAEGATNFTWYLNGTEVQSGTSATYTVTMPGSYTVRGTLGGCSGDASPEEKITLVACCENEITTVLTCEPSGLNVSVCHVQAAGGMNYEDAKQFCAASGYGWRLPTYDELACICIAGESLALPWEPAWHFWATGTQDDPTQPGLGHCDGGPAYVESIDDAYNIILTYRHGVRCVR
ncbi:MAG: PKD domain-containing protein [Prevotellaceae bacterium]|jgi:hypothetical protein|nr:PKD domain-containing protein [Prevotellaceae bacterium]